jgi:16S rRNA (cytosine967-C5)-methyltransferase
VNAVLRNFLRQREALLEKAAQSSDEACFEHPQWWIDKVKNQYPADWRQILSANLTHPPMTLRVNARRAAVDAYLARLGEAGLSAERLGGQAIRLCHPAPVDRLPGFFAGDVSVQDRGAQYAAALLDAQDGMRVLDACAAPGGKTAHLLERTTLDVTALDNDANRLARVGENLARLHLQAQLLQNDAAAVAAWWDGTPYDRILADVPCSASGVVRRHPDIKRLRRPEDITQFAATQQKILSALWQCLAQGGKLLYVTCSVFAEENQLQIQAHLARFADARLLPLPGLSEHDKQLLPNDQHDGFYYALLQKGGNAA